MKTFNRYIFTVICNINGENRKILINTFIIRNIIKNDKYISDIVEKFINQEFKKYFNDYPFNAIYDNIDKYTFQCRYESNNDLTVIIDDIVYYYDEVEKYIDCKFTNAVTKNLKLYNDNVLKWNDKNYDNFELVYKEK
jgi:hypothetical protein